MAVARDRDVGRCADLVVLDGDGHQAGGVQRRRVVDRRIQLNHRVVVRHPLDLPEARMDDHVSDDVAAAVGERRPRTESSLLTRIFVRDAVRRQQDRVLRDQRTRAVHRRARLVADPNDRLEHPRLRGREPIANLVRARLLDALERLVPRLHARSHRAHRERHQRARPHPSIHPNAHTSPPHVSKTCVECQHVFTAGNIHPSIRRTSA